MAARLGNVLYWLGCVLAVIFAIGGLAAFFIAGAVRPITNGEIIALMVPLFALSAISWMIGRALRYILGGT
jgi:hypothetical protein